MSEGISQNLDISNYIPTPSAQVCFVAYFLASWALAAIILLLIFFDLDMLKMDTFDI